MGCITDSQLRCGQQATDPQTINGTSEKELAYFSFRLYIQMVLHQKQSIIIS